MRAGFMMSAMSSSAVFYSVVFAGTCHNAFLRTDSSPSNASVVLRMSYKTQALRSLIEDISKATGSDFSEDLLLAIAILAVHDPGENLSAPPKHMHTPLRQHKDSEFYTSMRWRQEHLQMLYTMLERYGGLHALKLPGLAQVIEGQVQEILVYFVFCCNALADLVF